MAPRTRDWKALEMPDITGRRYELMVTGEVEVSASNKTPHLTSHMPQGFNPRILLLDLTISTGGDIGLEVMMWKPVRYQQATNGSAFDEVDILFEGEVIERIDVQHPKTVKPAGKTAKKAAKKSAAKKKTKSKKAVKKAKTKKAKTKKMKKKAARKKRL